MKTNMIQRILAVSMVAVIALSCRKSNHKPLDPEPAPVIGYLAKLEYAAGEYDSLFYNNDGSIRKVINHTTVPAPYNLVYVFEYDANKKISRITDNNGEYYDYKYINGQLTAVSHYAAGVKADFKMYDYTNGKLSSIEEYYNVGFNTPAYELSSKREIFYYPDGNIKQEINYFFDPQTHAPVKDATIEYLDYDGKYNPTDIVNRFLYFSQIKMTKNNERKVTTKYEASGLVTEYNFEYTYNDFSNPLTRKMTYVSAGQPHTETVTYYYY